jgi:tRNA-binding EMAP/Myf-like protein
MLILVIWEQRNFCWYKKIYKTEDLIGKKTFVVENLKPKK